MILASFCTHPPRAPVTPLAVRYYSTELAPDMEEEEAERCQITEIDELIGNIEAGLEASSLKTCGCGGRVGPRERPDERLTAAALRHKFHVHAVAGRVDGHVCPLAAVGANWLAVVRRTVVDSDVVERAAGTNNRQLMVEYCTGWVV